MNCLFILQFADYDVEWSDGGSSTSAVYTLIHQTLVKQEEVNLLRKNFVFSLFYCKNYYLLIFLSCKSQLLTGTLVEQPFFAAMVDTITSQFASTNQLCVHGTSIESSLIR